MQSGRTGSGSRARVGVPAGMAPLTFAAACMGALLSGCVMPPDLMDAPAHGPVATVPRDAGLSGAQPVASDLLDRARSRSGEHAVGLLETGDDALLARIHLIRAARHSIDIQTFIWIHDDSGSWVFRELLAAARRGVTVRVLVDAFVRPGLTAEEYAGLAVAHQNLEIRLFRPLSENAVTGLWRVVPDTFTRFTSLNRRMHGKILLVDGVAAILGGRNYQDSYFDRDPVFGFRDRDVLVLGPECAAIQAAFNAFWTDREAYPALSMRDLRQAIETGSAILPAPRPVPDSFVEIDRLANEAAITAFRPELEPQTVAAMRFLANPPEDIRRRAGPGADGAFEPLKEALLAAREEVLIQTPYSVLGRTMTRLVRQIRKDAPGVRIRISTNSLGSADHISVVGVAMKQRRAKIKDLQLEVHLARPVPGDIAAMVPRYPQLLAEADPSGEGPRFCLHSKSIVIDRAVCFVGSHNFDPRSFQLNSENGILIADAAFARRLAGLIERDLHPRNSWVLAARRLPPVIAQLNDLATAVTSRLPLFDLWPLEPVSCYEPLDEEVLRSPFDADFHEHYRDVGPLPGIRPGTVALRAHLMRAFGSFTAPLM